MQRRRWLSIAFVCLLAISAMSSIDWAPASASRLGQSVPTRTPTVTPGPTATFTATPAPVANQVPDATPATPVLLPTAGDAPAVDGGWVLGVVLLIIGQGLRLARHRWQAKS